MVDIFARKIHLVEIFGRKIQPFRHEKFNHFDTKNSTILKWNGAIFRTKNSTICEKFNHFVHRITGKLTDKHWLFLYSLERIFYQLHVELKILILRPVLRILQVVWLVDIFGRKIQPFERKNLLFFQDFFTRKIQPLLVEFFGRKITHEKFNHFFGI